MKTLFISLLRLGDLLMHLEVVKSYSKQYPEEELYVLVNEEISEVANLVPQRIQFLFFPRHQLQKQIVDRSYHFRHAYEQIEDLVAGWNRIHFDHVVNLTHNRTSAFLAGMLKASTKQGLRFEEKFIGQDENSWWSYLNHHFATQTISQYSYTHILRAALGLQNRKRILIHPFSNDSKKNWKLESFLEFARQLSQMPSVGVVGFVGTNEDFLKHPQVVKEFATCAVTFSQLREELLWSDGLVAVDSSVKHLAASLGRQVLEVAVGSASPSKYANQGTVAVLASEAPCFPCGYSQSCLHAMPICHDDISVPELIRKAISVFGLKQSMECTNGKNAELSA